MSYNKVVLIGRLGRDAETRYTQSGTAVASFSVATERYMGKDKESRTTWHRVTLWGKAAEALGQYLVKGSLVAVDGPYESREWTDKEGATRISYEVTAESVKLLGGGKRKEERDDQDYSSPPMTEDDIPF